MAVRQWIVAGGLVANAILLSVWISQGHSLGAALERTKAESDHLNRTLSFACGYIYGQRAIVLAANLPMKEPELTASCLGERERAVADGFTTAATEPDRKGGRGL